MKHGRLFFLAPPMWIVCVALLIVCGVTWFFSPIVAYVELGASLCLIIGLLFVFFHKQRDIDRYMRRVVRFINESEEQSLSLSPLPIAVITDDNQILWHNTPFELQVSDGVSLIGKKAELILNDEINSNTLYGTQMLEVQVASRHFQVHISPLSVRGRNLFVLYYSDITDLHDIREQFISTRPIVMMMQIDNLDEIMQRLRDSERARIESNVEIALEEWLGRTTAILRKIDDDRYFAVIESRYLDLMIESRFDILDRVKTIQIDNNAQITLSIGIGGGDDFRAAENAAKSALDMALGRGGDQAAVRTKNGFDFYGGQSRGVEKHTKVRTRVMASALQELITEADNVLVMGHRFSDLDAIGSAVTLVGVCRALGKPAYVAASRETTLAEELFVRFENAGMGDRFVDPSQALLMVRTKTLLIITDTQVPQMLESLPLYERVNTVAIIDHHRKTPNHCDKAVLFFHESYASSTCEMVSELVQYMNVSSILPLEAEALLSGIMLDTRNFVIKAGVRTFEAAAYLRKQGADTVSVKQMFSGQMGLYQTKSEIVSTAQFYRNTAISLVENGEGSLLRIACSQAADELLSIKDTNAAFVLFADAGCVNISARSYGLFNVQLVMEALGGGGHLTMAGAQLRGVTLQEANDKLKTAIDRYLETIHH